MDKKKTIIIFISLILVFTVAWLFQVESEISKIEITPDNEMVVPSVFPEIEGVLDEMEADDGEAFFIEYRLQRDRVRGQEIEMLSQFINNPNTSEDGKIQAEEKLLQIIRLMEEELLIESLIKAQGFDDAIFFYKDNRANVVVKDKNLAQEEYNQIAEIVSGMTAVKIEDIIIVEGRMK